MPFSETLPNGETVSPLGYLLPSKPEASTMEQICSIQSILVRNKVLAFLRENPHLVPLLKDNFDGGLAYFMDGTGNGRDQVAQFSREKDTVLEVHFQKLEDNIRRERISRNWRKKVRAIVSRKNELSQRKPFHERKIQKTPKYFDI